jgi:hypothetical protein
MAAGAATQRPDVSPAPEPGAEFLADIRAQPEALTRLLEHEAVYAEVAATLVERAPSALARAKGLDPDRPANLSKVTLAR